jgi:hypothetical protein
MSNQITIKVDNPLSREQFIEKIRHWTVLDNNLKIVSEKTKKMREMKHELTTEICNYMQETNNVNAKIGLSDGELRIYDKKEYSSITFGYIERCLAEIITDKSQIDFVMNYLKEHREVSSSLDIRRTYAKDKMLK